mgnify:CR=1 FL=1
MKLLLLLATVGGLLSLVPLITWAVSGSWRAGLRAGLQYLAIFGGMLLVVLVFAAITLLPEIWN